MTLKVMISSTALDLPEHHEQAINAGAVAESLEMVDDVDIYVGILAGTTTPCPKWNSTPPPTRFGRVKRTQIFEPRR